jgi:glycosyltransferase involved in cell wall biosynthesis
MTSQPNSRETSVNQPVVRHVCLYFPSYGDGGVEKMTTNLAHGLYDAGVKVDFIVHHQAAPYLSGLEHKVNFITPPDNIHRHLSWLVRYLNSSHPDVLMTVKDAAGIMAIKAKKRCRAETKIVVRTGTALLSRFDHRGANFVKQWLKSHKLKHYFQQADGHIAVALGSRKELHELIQIPQKAIIVIKNPVITPTFLKLQLEIIDHPWFAPSREPLIMGMGGFRLQKDFTTLINAFALLRKSRPCRLILAGKGRQEKRLLQLCHELGIQDDVLFPGFTDNPYPWLKRADLFVLSSLWEGSPNVLTEALALGTPVVATDCQSGPREILQDGKYGELVPLGDPQAMSDAMARALDKPLSSEQLAKAAKDYTLEASTRSYIRAFTHFMAADQG